jgi:hypothetical protein
MLLLRRNTRPPANDNGTQEVTFNSD